MNYRRLHTNVPEKDYDEIMNLIDSGQYVNKNDAARDLIRRGLQSLKNKEDIENASSNHNKDPEPAAIV